MAPLRSHIIASTFVIPWVSCPVARKRPSFDIAIHDTFLSIFASKKSNLFDDTDFKTATDPSGKTMNLPHFVYWRPPETFPVNQHGNIKSKVNSAQCSVP